ncbi:MAG: Hcp family type VI secretion system effector [Aquabacterium sp.]
MAIAAFMKYSNAADGESKQKGFDKWIEVQGWDWEVEAESSWTKGGGASVGKPNPGKANFEYYFCTASPIILKFITAGNAFEKVELVMCKTTGKGLEEYFRMDMGGCYITKVTQNGGEDGNVVQKTEMVFKTVEIKYKMQDDKTGALQAKGTFKWNIPSGEASN